MNKLTLFFNYFSDPRFSEILAQFGIDQKSNETRANLIDQLLESENFREDLLQVFLYKAELRNFCKSAGFSRSSGTKKQIWERIKSFLRDIDSKSIIISKNEKYTELSFNINNKIGKMRDSSEMLKFNALSVAHRLVDHGKFEDEEEKAIKALKDQHPERTLEVCRESFNYALILYKEAIKIVESNSDVLWKDLPYFLKNSAIKRKRQPFENKFLEKYTELNESDLWIFDWIFFWYHLK